MYSHEQLINAVRAAGRDGKTFSVKDIRVQLGFQTRDKKELSRFRRRLRAFEKDAGEQLEKVGNNSYRLKPGAFATAAPEAAASETAAAPTNMVQEPASGVFETIQAPDAIAQLEASESTTTTTPPSAAAAQLSAAVEAVLQQPAEQLAAADVVNLSAVHDVPAGPVAVHVAEQPAANDAPPAQRAEPVATPHAAADVIAAQPAPAEAPAARASDEAPAAPSRPIAARVVDDVVTVQAASNDAPAPAIAARVAEAASNGAAKVATAVQQARTNGAAAKPAPQPSAAVAATAPRAGCTARRAVMLA
jgi:hypothetical protein